MLIWWKQLVDEVVMEEIIQEALSKGVEMHVAGEFDLAGQMYESVIKLQPNHADANHNMGLLKLDIGLDLEALPFLQTALQADTSIAQFWLSYVKALIKLERLDEATRILDLAKENGFEGEEFVELNQLFNTATDSAPISEPEADIPSQSEPNILDSLKLNQACNLAKKDSTGRTGNNVMNARIPFGACPLCESIEIKESITGDCSKHSRYVELIPSRMQWMDCENCAHQFIDGYFSEEALKVLFSQVGQRQTVGFDIENQRRVSAKIIEKVLPFQNSGIWLDVGFGNGSLIFTAEEFGFEVIGVDLRPQSVAAMKGLGYNVYCENIQNLCLSQKLSVASLMDVLEHVPYPKETLMFLFDNMQDDGCLILSMPNSENFIWRIMTDQNENPYFGELEHYHNFSRTRLVKLLDECGFNVVRYGISERYRCCMELVAVRRRNR